MPRRLAIVLTSVLIMIAIAVWVVTREATLIWAVNQAVKRSGGTIEVSGVNGCLLYGPIGFARIDYRSQGLEVSADRGRVDFARWSLLLRKLVVHRVDVDSITVIQHRIDRSEPAKPPQQLHVPVALTVKEFRTNRIELVRDESRVAAGPLVASARTQPMSGQPSSNRCRPCGARSQRT
jgi:autotransporter translocation and assembly factor TamB